MELSEEQAEKNKYEKEDIRITAWRFYTTENQTNSVTPFLGNGIPSEGNSVWGIKHMKTIYYEYGGNGCFTVDVGWAGFYWLFGLFATLALMTIMIKAIIRKKPDKESYMSYGILFFLITSITAGPILFSQQIVSLCLILYLIYGNSKIYSRNNTQLQ